MLVFPIACCESHIKTQFRDKRNLSSVEMRRASKRAPLAFAEANVRSKSESQHRSSVPWLTNTRWRWRSGKGRRIVLRDAKTQNEGTPGKTPGFGMNVNTRFAFRAWHVRVYSRPNRCKSRHGLRDEFKVFPPVLSQSRCQNCWEKIFARFKQ